MKISLIDDDAQMRMMLEDFIRGKFPVADLASYHSGEEALKNISEIQDLVVLDYNLDSVTAGGLNGIEVFKKLKERQANIPVIFISGQEKSKVAASTILHGAKDYIIKDENIFNRLETSMNAMLGKANGKTESAPKKKISTAGIIIAIVILLAGLVTWKMTR